MIDVLKEVRQVARLARDAGAVIMEVYNSGSLEVMNKADASPVTRADLAANSVIVQGLAETALPVLSEESREIPYAERQGWRQFWLVDPLDGTREFVDGAGSFTVNIALIEEGFPVLGVVFAPAMDALYFAAKGLGAFAESKGKTKEIRVSARSGGRLRVAASKSHRGDRLDAFLLGIGEYEEVSIGSSLKFCLVAEGTADLYPRLGPTMEWDTAAAQCIVEEAGGRVEDLAGCRLTYNKPDLHNPEFMAYGNLPFSYRESLRSLTKGNATL